MNHDQHFRVVFTDHSVHNHFHKFLKHQSGTEVASIIRFINILYQKQSYPMLSTTHIYQCTCLINAKFKQSISQPSKRYMHKSFELFPSALHLKLFLVVMKIPSSPPQPHGITPMPSSLHLSQFLRRSISRMWVPQRRTRNHAVRTIVLVRKPSVVTAAVPIGAFDVGGRVGREFREVMAAHGWLLFAPCIGRVLWFVV